MADIRDDVARAEGWTWGQSVDPEAGDFQCWREPRPDNPSRLRDVSPIPELTDDACLGYALRRIRELGWEWTKTYNGFLAHDCREMRRAGPIQTGNDASDALHLLLAVLAATKGVNNG